MKDGGIVLLDSLASKTHERDRVIMISNCESKTPSKSASASPMKKKEKREDGTEAYGTEDCLRERW